MSHMGRPKGEKNLKYSLSPVAMHLANFLINLSRLPMIVLAKVLNL